MITCRLGKKEYFIEQISGRALREIQPALEAYGELAAVVKAASAGEPAPASTMTVQEMCDRIVAWFCIVFGNQFTPEMVYNLYPASRMINDFMLVIMAVIQARDDVLDSFPTKAARKKNP